MPLRSDSLLSQGALGPEGLSPLYGLGLKNHGKIKNPRTLAQVCVEVESMFLSHLLEVMRKTMVRSLHTQSPWQKQYQSLTDQHVARALAHGGGLGLARQLYETMAPRLFDHQREKNNGPRTNQQEGRESEPAGNLLVPGAADLSAAGNPGFETRAGRLAPEGGPP